jgi:type 2 lantibiotic biosynthesis protein LanM
MLPSRGWEQAGRPGADISGIGGWSGQRSGLRMPFPVNVGTDLMQVRLDEGDTEGAANQPAPDLKPRDLLAYTENLVAGFTEVYHALLAAQDELLAPGGPVAAFAGDHVRVLARHTKYYAVLHVASYHPDILRDGAVRDRHYDRLWAEVANVPALANFIRGEREDLRRNDIPVFTAELGGTDVLTADGERVPGLIRKSGLQAVEERVRSLDEDDLQRQVWLIRASMAAAATDLSPALVYPSYPLDRTPAPERPTGAELVETADEIAQRLLAVAFRDGRQAEWLGTNSARGQSWSIGTLGPDLYHGLTGVGVFFAAIGAATGDPAYLGITRDIRRTVELQLARGTLSGMGGTSGLPGHLYGARLIAAQLGEDDPVAAVPDLAIRLLEVIDLDAEFDVSSGAAGTILQLRHQGRWARGDLRGTVVAAADALCAAQDPVTGGWLAPSMVEIGLTTQPLAGLAHGAAGGAWALLEAERLTGESRYRDAALRAFDYERTLFLPEFQNWHDVRDPYILSGGRDGEQPPPIVAWCHGAAGIALARARGADLLSAAELSDVDDEIHAGVTTVLSEGFGTNHSLCHGDLGNLDVVRQTAADAPDWSQSADRMLARIVQSLRLDGPLCGMPQGVETPGLMTGLAGIGYGLLNAADPGRWPSVLSYDLPE